jgi:hypothetical protein
MWCFPRHAHRTERIFGFISTKCQATADPQNTTLRRAVTFFAVSRQKMRQPLGSWGGFADRETGIVRFWDFRKESKWRMWCFSRPTHRTERIFGFVSAKCQATADTQTPHYKMRDAIGINTLKMKKLPKRPPAYNGAVSQDGGATVV